MENAYDLDLLFIVLTGKVSLVVNRALTRSFKVEKIDLTPEQFTVLAHLWKNDDVTQQQLCTSTNKDKPSITRLIDGLEKLELVQRISDPTDRRINLIHLTAQGNELKDNAVSTALDVMKKALDGVSPEQLNACRQVLKKVLVNIS